MTRIFFITLFPAFFLFAETFKPYQEDEVPQNVTDLWKNYDPSKEPLKIKIVREWKSDGVVTRYVTFTIGTFKGKTARLAAYYSFPDNGVKNPAFVWSHGGGQRAERKRGIYFAKQGYATIDINWLGRQMEKDISENTDWGKVDPTQGPRFYPKALRKHWKLNLQPDEHTIDSVVSPRNSNWFLLAVAARRAITFLEQQKEVNSDKIGFSGFSMGGMITSFAAIDKRLKAVAPFVGGTGFKHINLPGIERSSLAVHLRDKKLYGKTIDSSAYWPLVTCPVMFISSSNDFHAAFERISKSMNLLHHKNWRVSTNIHANHSPGPEQWVMLNKWFDLYLKNKKSYIPKTPTSSLIIKDNKATFIVSPETIDLIETEVYYSYDPNARSRFWHRAATTKIYNTWQTEIKIYKKAPLYVHAICRYKMPNKITLERGETSTFALNSDEQIYMPKDFDISALKSIQNTRVIEDFKNGLQDWHSRRKGEYRTYKFRNPHLSIKKDDKLKILLNPSNTEMLLTLKVESKFLKHGENLGNFTLIKTIPRETKEIVIKKKDFISDQNKELEWDKVAVFSFMLQDPKSKSPIVPISEKKRTIFKSIILID